MATTGDERIVEIAADDLLYGDQRVDVRVRDDGDGHRLTSQERRGHAVRGIGIIDDIVAGAAVQDVVARGAFEAVFAFIAEKRIRS